jgi:hypothetical protein
MAFLVAIPVVYVLLFSTYACLLHTELGIGFFGSLASLPDESRRWAVAVCTCCAFAGVCVSICVSICLSIFSVCMSIV